MKFSNAGKTTMSFRIMPDSKLRIAGVAKKLGMSPSQYVEALVMERHNEVVKAINNTHKAKRSLPWSFSDEQEERFQIAFNNLKAVFPKRGSEELLIASVILTNENHNAFWQTNLDHVLGKLETK